MEEFYDELERRCTEAIELSPGGPVVALNIPIGQWHTVRALESGTVIMEVKDGPYEPTGEEDIDLGIGLPPVATVKSAADRVEGEFLTEECVPTPIGPYGESKIAAENYIIGKFAPEVLNRPFHNFSDEDAVVDGKKVYIMRPCMIHGPGNKGNLNLLYGVESKGIPWPLGAFESRRSFTNIGNLQEVIRGLLTKDVAIGIYHMGDDEALLTNELIEASDIHARLGLEKGKYILLSAHREENIDTEKNFLSLFNAINKMAEKYDMPILYSCHPRSRKRLEASGFKLDPRVIQHEPLGFHDYNCLQMNAFAVVSDSGTLPEESSFFTSIGHPFPAVCIRTSTERPEALDKGCFVLSGIDTIGLLQSVDVTVSLIRDGLPGIPVPDYVDENVSTKVVRIIQSYVGVVNKMVWRKE